MTRKNHTFSVQAAATAAGVPPGTLRMWEQRYAVVAPVRTDSGHRRYDQQAVERLKAIAALVRNGHAISAVARLSNDMLTSLLVTTRTGAPVRVSESLGAKLDLLRRAVEEFDMTRAAKQLRWLRTALGARSFVLQVAVPLFGDIGRLVAQSKLDISQEHALSAVLRDQIGDLLHTLQGLDTTDGSSAPMVFASPEDDRHEFGILLGAVLAAVRNTPVWYGGADLPAASLATATKAVKADTIILGNAPIPATERRISFEDYLLQLDSALPAEVALFVGGTGDRPRSVLPSGRRVHYLNSIEELDDVLERRVTAAKPATNFRN